MIQWGKKKEKSGNKFDFKTPVTKDTKKTKLNCKK